MSLGYKDGLVCDRDVLVGSVLCLVNYLVCMGTDTVQREKRRSEFPECSSWKGT
jgi:hypothetical protein